MSVSRDLLDILVCPKCRGELDYHEAEKQLICLACQLVYPVEKDVPIMLIDQSHTLDEQYSG
ncbi:MAG: Trm112 family protein [Fidelibacterota bacterium]|nr:MAG: Trm112 family protein [Candidatus Neomarinimicrobiota bacterium]